MIADKNRVYDGFDNLSGGVDDGRAPHLIDQNQCAEAQNAVFRGGVPRTRPGILDLTHTFENELYYTTDGDLGGSAGPGTDAAFQDGVFQGASYYSPQGFAESFVASIGGRLFQLIPTRNRTVKVLEILMDRRNSENKKIAYQVQADRFLITQDGESKAIIYDGVSARRAAENEIVTGTVMAYGLGRLMVVRDQDIYFGDLYGSHAGLPGDSVLKFEETTYLAEGFPTSVNSSLGRITAAFFASQQDSATGDGELMVSAERGMVSFFLSRPRDQWKDSAFQRISLQNVGVRGHRTPVEKNGDVWFRSDDGCRSYRQARAEISGWAHLPLSTNVRKWIENDTPELLDYASAIAFDNRVLFTCTPQPNEGKLYHAGLLSLDFDVLSSFGQSSKPAWDGHWSKLKITQLVQGMFEGEHRAFAFALDDNNQNHLYELSRSERRDFDGPITTEITGRAMTFVSNAGGVMPYNEKELYGGDIWLDDITDPVTVTVSYRSDQHPTFQPWQTIPTIAPKGVCGALTCGGCPTVQANFLPRRRLAKPADGCSDFTGNSIRRGFEFQPRLQWTGHAALRRLRLHAIPLHEDSKGSC